MVSLTSLASLLRPSALALSRAAAGRALFSSLRVADELVPLLADPKLSQWLQSSSEAAKDPLALPKFLLEDLKPLKLLPKPFVMSVLEKSIAYHHTLPNVVERERAVDGGGTRGALTVCGDTHGQYSDFCRIFHPSLAGFPSDANRFIFNGDVTDRGPMGLEILLVLLTTQLCQPSAMTLLRGNHETFGMNKDHGFLQEVLSKYDQDVFFRCEELFAALPLGATIEKKVFVVHGGLGKRTAAATIADINAQDRKVFDVDNDDSILTEMLWSDPKDGIKGLLPSQRGIAARYGPDITNAFLQRNDLRLVIRSHECEQDGYKLLHGGRSLTVFSAPNYCGAQRNKGAVVRFGPQSDLTGDFPEYDILQFSEEKVGPHTLQSTRSRLQTLTRQAIARQRAAKPAQ